jgi:hypothetical protein
MAKGNKLSGSEEKFAMELFRKETNPKAGLTQYQCYINAYPNRKNSPKEQVEVDASKSANSPKILQRIEELRKPIQEKFNKSVEDILNEIEQLKNSSLSEDDKRLALDCLKEQTKILGYYEKDNSQKGDKVVVMGSVKIDGKEQKDIGIGE